MPDKIRRLSRPRLYERVAVEIAQWAKDAGLKPGDRLPPERELATRLGVSRATVSQSLVAMEVVGAVIVRHGDGVVLTPGTDLMRAVTSIQAHTRRLPDILDARDALETKLAALAAARRTDDDLRAVNDALDVMQADIDAGGRGTDGDELFHRALTEAAHSELIARIMRELHDQIRETRIESLGQTGRPRRSLRQHRRIADAVAAGDADAAAAAMHEHVLAVSRLAILRAAEGGVRAPHPDA